MSARPPQSAKVPPSPSSTPDPLPHGKFPIDPIPTIIPGASVNLLAGAPGVGKTALIAWLLVRFRDQLAIFGHQPSALPKIAILCADRSWEQSTSKWFVLAGYPELCAYSLLDDEAFNVRRLRQKQQRIDILQESINALHLPWGSLLIVDPLALFLGGNILDYDNCGVACAEIRQICRRRGITIIGTAHSSKQKADKQQRYLRLQDRIAGSTALFGYTDTQMYLASPEEIGEDFHLFHWTPHHAPAEDFKLRKDSNGLFVPYDDPRGVHDLTAFARQVLDFVDVAPELTKMKDLITRAQVELGMSRSALYRYVDQLAAEHLLIKVGRGAVCRPKPQ